MKSLFPKFIYFIPDVPDVSQKRKREREREIDREIERQRDRETDRQREREREREIERENREGWRIDSTTLRLVVASVRPSNLRFS